MGIHRFAAVVLTGVAVVAGADGAGAAEAARPGLWGGFYAGAMGALSRNVITGTALTSAGTVSGNSGREFANVKDRSGGPGAFVGWRRQFEGGFVAGLEADAHWLNHDASNVNRLSTGQTVAELRYQTNLLSTGRLTAGWSFGDVLVFGTGGVALAHERETRTQYRLISGVSVAQFSETANVARIGLAVGAGAEWRITGGWSLRADTLYARFPRASFLFPDARGGAQGSFTSVQGRIANNRSHATLVRIGLSYTFGTGN